MRVLMTADAVGGVWTYSLDLARALAARGVQTTLATMGPAPSDEQRRDARSIPGLRLEEGTWKLEWMQDPWRDVAEAGAWLLRLEREHDVDLVHLNGYAHAALPWGHPTVVVAHSCVFGWWEAVHGVAPPEAEWARYREAVARGLQAADLVVAPTRAMLDTLAGHYGARGGPTQVILNGRAPAALAPAADERKDPVILAVGRVWDPAKDVATLDAAAEGAAWPVHVVGDPRHPETGAALPLRHAQAEGRVDAATLARWYARASVYASAAVYEPFGLGAVEAAQAGCALLLPDLPSLREVWGDAATYARPRNADSFRDRIRALAEDPDLRQRLAARARTRAADLTADAMADAYLAAYRRLVGASSPVSQEESPFAS